MTLKLLRPILVTYCFIGYLLQINAQQSVARRWNEALLQSIREDFARPPVQARNLYHSSMAMYDAWAAYDTTVETCILGKIIGNQVFPYTGIPVPANIESARNEAISFAAYRVLINRFNYAPNPPNIINRFRSLMTELGYDYNNTSEDYTSGSPAALGNLIGRYVVTMGLIDGANEFNNYAIQFYAPVNPPLTVATGGNNSIVDPNRWQPLKLTTAIDQNGNPVSATQKFQSPEWGNVRPFALSEANKTTYFRNNTPYYVYHDPGSQPLLDTANGGGGSSEYQWNFGLTSVWSSHHTTTDGVMWDISPRSIGNVQSYPTTLAEYHDFYKFEGGGDIGTGRTINPRTGQPYAPQMVPRGDYTRVLAQYWADGPSSETPPGHWFAITNKVSDSPLLVKKFNGKGPVLANLEWDVKAYLTLGGAVHDAAISAWGIKGWYDGVRPISAIRYLAKLGQSSDPTQISYHPAGIQLVPGYIELVLAGDPLAGSQGQNIGKIKLNTWRGNAYIVNPIFDVAGVGWILADFWEPYQRATFVTPPFGGYISGHSTYSSAAAEVLTMLTGDPYFPGGMGAFNIAANSGFLGLEQGPSMDVTLQWATYRDASDQTSLSRIWGGIHPPFDDIPGRIIGKEVGKDAFSLARSFFYKDIDGDGYFSYEDCDDSDLHIYPNAPELCDNIDNNCDGQVDEGLIINNYYADADGDGFGNAATAVSSCQSMAPMGFVANSLDCDDQDTLTNPAAPERCDGIDNNCNGLADDGIAFYDYYLDGDGDGFGTAANAINVCDENIPTGYVTNNQDCDDQDALINPDAAELCDTIDNNCNGMIDDGIVVYNYYEDNDGDGYGSIINVITSCNGITPVGYVVIGMDCDDENAVVNPGSPDICDGLDNDCNGQADDQPPIYEQYLDADGDGFGSYFIRIDTCASTLTGFVLNNLDCNDNAALINPIALEIVDGFDNDCNGDIDDVSGVSDLIPSLKIFPNPVTHSLNLIWEGGTALQVAVYNSAGILSLEKTMESSATGLVLDFSGYTAGLYFVKIMDTQRSQYILRRVVKL